MRRLPLQASQSIPTAAAHVLTPLHGRSHTFTYVVHTCTDTHVHAQNTHTCIQSTSRDTWVSLTSEEGLCPLPVTCSCLSAKSILSHTHMHTHKLSTHSALITTDKCDYALTVKAKKKIQIQ